MSEEKKPETQALAKPSLPVPVRVGESGLKLQSYDEMLRFAKMVSQSSIIPEHFRENPSNCFVALQHGLELGLKPMQTFKSIMVVNGIPSIYGDAALALCRKSGKMDPSFGSGGIREWSEGEGEDLVCYCETKRAEATEPHKSQFSWKDALAAGLAQNDKKLYKKYPKRMCGFRARGFELRDNFGDVLLGLVTVEEVMDYEILDEVGEFQPPAASGPKFDKAKVNVAKSEVRSPESEVKDAEYTEEPSGYEEMQNVQVPEKESPPVTHQPVKEEAVKAEPAPKPKGRGKAKPEPPPDPAVEADIATMFGADMAKKTEVDEEAVYD